MAFILDPPPETGVNIPGDPNRVISVRQNNPGNLKFVGQPGAKEGAGGFAIFETPEAGFEALQNQIEVDKKRGLNLTQFGYKYAPPHENDTPGWISNVAKLTGYEPGTLLAQIPTVNLAMAVAKQESGTVINQPMASSFVLDEPPAGPAKPSLTLGKPATTPVIAPTPAFAPPVDPTSASLGMFQPETIGQGLTTSGLGPQLTAQLPVIGMLGGGTIGATAGGGLGAVPGAALGAGAGKAGEMAINQYMGWGQPQTPGQQVLNVGKEMLGGATAEVGGQVAGRLLGEVPKWAQNQIAKVESFNAQQELIKKGFPLEPTAVAPNWLTNAITNIATRLEPGKSIAQSYRRNALDMLYQMRSDFVEQGMGLPAVGSMALGKPREITTGVFQKFKESYPMGAIPLPQTQEYLKNLDPTTLSSKSSDFIIDSQRLLSKGSLTTKELEMLNNDLWKGYNGLKAQDKDIRRTLLDTIYKDLESSEIAAANAVGEALKAAKLTTRELKQANILEGLLNKATDNVNMTFNPISFYEIIKKNQSTIAKSFDPDQVKNIYNFAEMMKAAGPTFQAYKGANLPQTPFWQVVSSGPGVGLMTSAAMSGNYALLIPIGFQAWVARSLMNPSGMVRAALTKKMPPLPAGAIGLGTKMAIQKEMEE